MQTQIMPTQIQAAVQRFIAENFLFRDDRMALSPTESLLEAGLIDSTGILELVGFVESEFGVRVADADIVPDNFDSVHAIAAYIGRKRVAAA